MGVRQLNEFNIALLGKWCWRMLVDRGGFWYRVLVARYGEVCGRLEDGGQSGSSWWRKVGWIRDGGGGVGGGWFQECVTNSDLKPHNVILTNYEGTTGNSLGAVEVDLIVGSVSRTTMFMVVPSKANFNVLLGRRSEERRVGKECRSRWSPYH